MSIVIYSGSEDWSAVYLDGKLERVGDHYLIDEWVRAHFNVETRDSDAFMQGGNHSQDVAKTLSEAEAFEVKLQQDKAKAAELRRKAQELLDEAAALS